MIAEVSGWEDGCLCWPSLPVGLLVKTLVAREEGKMEEACHSFVTQRDILWGSLWLVWKPVPPGSGMTWCLHV